MLYFWAIRSHDRQVEINTYLLTRCIQFTATWTCCWIHSDWQPRQHNHLTPQISLSHWRLHHTWHLAAGDWPQDHRGPGTNVKYQIYIFTCLPLFNHRRHYQCMAVTCGLRLLISSVLTFSSFSTPPTIAIIILSVCLSVCHTADPRVNCSVYQNNLCTTWYRVMFRSYFRPNFSVQSSPQTNELNRVTACQTVWPVHVDIRI